MEKKKLLVSFSGGETSAFMAQWLWTNKRNEYDMEFVFANTGEENEETLIFVEQCSKYFGFKVTWIECVINGYGVGTSFRIVDFKTASRNGEPFELMILKYGIPNKAYPHCTRELKTNPITAYAKSLGWEDWYTAIGIRIDEIDRMSPHREKMRFIYPLIDKEMKPMTKKHINFWWRLMPFRLELKGYQGNCKTCWKKTDNKLFQLAQENEYQFNFMAKMEARYGRYIPPARLAKAQCEGRSINLPITFFRKNRSAIDIINESKNKFKRPTNDAEVYPDPDLFDNESCEVFTECGT